MNFSMGFQRFMIAGVLVTGGHLLAETTETAPTETDDIAANLERARETSAADGSEGTLGKISDLRTKWREAIGLDYSVSSYAYAAGIVGGDDVPVSASGEIVLQGIWNPGKRWSENPVELRFRARDRQSLGTESPATLGQEQGTLWGIADGFTDAGFQVPDFFFRHVFSRTGTELRYGQMTIDSQFDTYALQSSKQSFLSQAFATNPAVAFPNYGAGLTLVQNFDNGWGIAIGASNMQGTPVDQQDVDIRFDSKSLFEAIEVSYEFKMCGDRASRIEMMAWHSDAVEDVDQNEGQGLSLTFEQDMPDLQLRAFTRFAVSDGGAAPVDLFASSGIAMEMKGDDLAGVAVGIGRGADAGRPVQSVFEAFYRWQLRDGIQVTPDFQLILGQGLVDSPGVRWVAGVRAGIAF